MAGRLTNKEKDQLEEWIGTGPKTFTLLYAITRDGCNASTFHDKCDGQGPNVTVLYNTQGSVYGGYNSTNWSRHVNSYVSSADAFLFQLRYNDNLKTTKFPLKESGHQHAVYSNSNYGPTFGGGHDLHTFTNTVNLTGSFFPLNGYANFGSSYEMQGINANDINNGTMNVTELQVYKVTYDEKKDRDRWREVDDWNKKLLESLKEEITSFKPVTDLSIREAKIAVIGPVGAGKSSLYNTIESVFRGRIAKRACSGSAEQSITSGYIPYTVRTESGGTLNFLLCDTPGLEDSGGLDVDECGYLLDGNVPNFYQFNPKSPLTPETEGFRTEPTSEDIMHCVVFVLDSTTLDALSSEVVEKMKQFKSLMNKRGIPQLIALTKIDKLCKDVAADVSFAYKSWVVEEHVEKASQLLGLPRSSVLPVKNYEKETTLDMNINILALLALRQILHSAEDFMFNLLDRRRFAEMSIREN